MENTLKMKQNILAEVVDCLCDSEHGMLSWKGKGGRLLPSRDRVIEAAVDGQCQHRNTIVYRSVYRCQVWH